MLDQSGLFPSKLNRPWWHKPMRYIIGLGPIPKHIAFIMDGNRRYARYCGFQNSLIGHSKGFDQLTKIIEWCADFAVKELTVYAFSIENFKRSEDEINGLMALFEQKLIQILQEREMLVEKQVAFRFFGEKSYLPLKIQKLTAQLELFTKDFTKSAINVCIAYTAQDEMKRAIVYISKGIEKGLLTENDINYGLISQCLDSRNSRKLDLLIRTSGEKRLSDFLLWQSSNCYVHFEDALWPDFDFWHLCKAILCYQFNNKQIEYLNSKCNEQLEHLMNDRIQNFLLWMQEDKLNDLMRIAEISC
ncbi:unnamed protein product [Dracunculus medinensis]|uniref:Alkyl transferase n=1 Tax=Dracunculus medinensis TaxID=318479 RepID=A0A0N4UHL5_DRAME|nr:unnamed protein product [Dracunculus medinensis]